MLDVLMRWNERARCKEMILTSHSISFCVCEKDRVLS